MMNKITFVLPTLKQGGMERVVVELANFYSKQGFEINIICLFRAEVMYFVEPSVKIRMPDLEYNGTVFNKIKVFNKLYANLKRYSKDCIVLGFGERFNSLSILACRMLSLKIFISDRNNPLANNGYLNDKIRNLLYPFANGIIAQTEFSKGHFQKLSLNQNILAIPNPLKDIVVYPRKSKVKKIITVGRLDKGKNHSQLIEIFSEIGNLSWELLIVGDGVLRNELERLIKELALEKNVFLVGASDDVDRWLCEADIFAFTSLHEGFPNALNEAMAYPLASIAYDCPAGPSEMIIDSENGFLVPLGDKQSYSKKLKLLMDDSPLRENLKSQSIKAREKYNVSAIANKILTFINKN